MKKLICAVLILSAVFAAYAEIDKPNRFLEFGVQADVMLNNSYLALGDILTPEIIIDFDEMLNSADDSDGMRIGINPNSSAFVNINFGQGFRLSGAFGIHGSVNMSLPTELIKLLANGNVDENGDLSDDPVTASIKANPDLTAELAVGFGSKIGPVAFMVTPKAFLPIVYLESLDAKYTLTTTAAGLNSLSAGVSGKMYSAFDFAVFEDEDGFNTLMAAFQENFGLDVTVAAEMPIFSFLDIGVSVSNIPFKSAVLNYETAFGTTEDITITADNVLGTITSGEEGAEVVETSEGTFEMQDTTKVDGYSVSRKIKVGLTAAWRPFNNRVLSIVPSMVYKFDSLDEISVEAFETSAFDFGVRTDVRLLKNFLGLNFATFCEDEIWTNKIGLMLNIRLVEIDVNVYTQGYTFADSFLGGNGFGVGTAVKVGI